MTYSAAWCARVPWLIGWLQLTEKSAAVAFTVAPGV